MEETFFRQFNPFAPRVVTGTGFLMPWRWQIGLASYIPLIKGGVL